MEHLYGELHKVVRGGTMQRFLAILGLLTIPVLISPASAQGSLMPVGRPAERSRLTPRRPLDKIVHGNCF